MRGKRDPMSARCDAACFWTRLNVWGQYEEQARRVAAGEKQRMCYHCNLWSWDDELESCTKKQLVKPPAPAFEECVPGLPKGNAAPRHSESGNK